MQSQVNQAEQLMSGNGILPNSIENPGTQQMIPAPTLMAALPEGAQQFCLRWNSYPATVATQLATLRAAEDFVDVTLACEGRQLRAHKLVLSACSPYFMQLFKSTPCQHPVIFLRDVGFRQLVALLEFMYAGEVNVSQVELPALLRTAEALQVRGLADTTANNNNNFPPQQLPQKHIFTQQYAPTVTSPAMIPPPVLAQQQQQQQQQQQEQHQQQQQQHQQQQQQHQPQQLQQQQMQPHLTVPMQQQQSGASSGMAEPIQQPQSATPTQGRKRRRKGTNPSDPKPNPTEIEIDDSSSDSNDSQDEFGNGESEMNQDHSGMEVQNTAEPYNVPVNNAASGSGGGEVQAERIEDGHAKQEQESSHGELGSASFGGSQSEEETSDEEDDDDDDDGEIKDEFTYQSDASYSQDLRDGEVNPNPNGENVAGPSTGSPAIALPNPELSGSKEEGSVNPDRLPGGHRNRLSRSLWPPGIPYHGPQQCPYCPRILSNVGNWRKHVLTMHFAREKNHKCRHCNSSFRTAEYLQKHYVRVHSYPQKMTRRKYVENT